MRSIYIRLRLGPAAAPVMVRACSSTPYHAHACLTRRCVYRVRLSAPCTIPGTIHEFKFGADDTSTLEVSNVL